MHDVLSSTSDILFYAPTPEPGPYLCCLLLCAAASSIPRLSGFRSCVYKHYQLFSLLFLSLKQQSNAVYRLKQLKGDK